MTVIPSPCGKKYKARFRKTGFSDKSKTLATEKEAYQWLKDYEALVTGSSYVDPGDLAKKTFGELIDTYVKESTLIKEHGKTKKAAIRAIHRALGSEKATNITSHRLISYIKSRLAQGAGGVTIKMDLGFIKEVLTHARITYKAISMDIFLDVRQYVKQIRLKTKSVQRDRRPTEGELTALKNHFISKKRQKIPMWDIIDFAVKTAMRAAEICRIEWADLNEADQTVIIRKRKDPQNKDENDQVVPILDDAWKILMAQPRTDKRIFPFDEKTFSTIFPRACQACKIINLHFHDLRHEGTSQLFEMGYEIQEAAVFTGHKDWTQLKRYVHLRAKDLHFDKHGNRRVRRTIAPELMLQAA